MLHIDDRTMKKSEPEGPPMWSMHMPMFIKLLVVLIPLFLPWLSNAQEKARPAQGKVELLQTQARGVNKHEFQKAPNALQQYLSKKGTFALWLPPGIWEKSAKPLSEHAEVTFTHKDGEAYGMIIAERTRMDLEALREVVLENMQKADKEATIVQEEKRVVNGTEVLCLVIKAHPNGVPITYDGYYYTGDAGTIQALTWTGQNLFEELKPELERFLNGLEIREKKPEKPSEKLPDAGWLSSSPQAPDDVSRRALEQLQGTWAVAKMEVAGRDEAGEFRPYLGVVIARDLFIFTETGHLSMVDQINLDASQKPAAITLLRTGKGEGFVHRGIYVLEKDTLTLCLVEGTQQERPKEFVSTKEPETMLLVLQRVTK